MIRDLLDYTPCIIIQIDSGQNHRVHAINIDFYCIYKYISITFATFINIIFVVVKTSIFCLQTLTLSCLLFLNSTAILRT